MKLKLDENLGASIEAALNHDGFDVATVLQEHLCGAGDRDLIETCRVEGRVLVTMDMDFANPLVFDPCRYHGIVVLRLPKKPVSSDLSAAVVTLSEGLNRNSPNGRLWIVSPGIIREYEAGE